MKEPRRSRRRVSAEKKPSTSELLDWLKLLVSEDIGPEELRERERALEDQRVSTDIARERAAVAERHDPTLDAPTERISTRDAARGAPADDATRPIARDGGPVDDATRPIRRDPRP